MASCTITPSIDIRLATAARDSSSTETAASRLYRPRKPRAEQTEQLATRARGPLQFGRPGLRSERSRDEGYVEVARARVCSALKPRDDCVWISTQSSHDDAYCRDRVRPARSRGPVRVHAASKAAERFGGGRVSLAKARMLPVAAAKRFQENRAYSMKANNRRGHVNTVGSQPTLATILAPPAHDERTLVRTKEGGRPQRLSERGSESGSFGPIGLCCASLIHRTANAAIDPAIANSMSHMNGERASAESVCAEDVCPGSFVRSLLGRSGSMTSFSLPGQLLVPLDSGLIDGVMALRCRARLVPHHRVVSLCKAVTWGCSARAAR
jgi:hypothetical protein